MPDGPDGINGGGDDDVKEAQFDEVNYFSL
jgi:hypothetical protein